MTKVSDVMTRGVRTLAPRESVMLAAQAMSELDVGVIPVCNGRRLEGIVTDRDIVLRAVAQGRAPDSTPLSDVMTREACWCFEDQSIEEAGEQMRDAQIRRLPVVDRDRRLVGMLSLGDISTRGGDGAVAGEALQDISEPSQPDRSGQSAASGAAGGGASKDPTRDDAS